jgi:hypothetical protein
MTAHLNASVMVYEGFSNLGGQAVWQLHGATSAGTGISGNTWSTGADTTATYQNLKEKLSTDAAHNTAITGGYIPGLNSSGKQITWEQKNNWNVSTATISLTSSIDFTTDGTYYMSFYSLTDQADYLAQMGLDNGTNELMFGNSYNGSGAKGLTAYYQGIGGSLQTNANGTSIGKADATTFQAYYYVAKFEKTNSATTDDVTVSFSAFNLSTNPDIGSADPAWARTVALSGVDTSFNTLRLKLSGGSNNPTMDELRIGQSWADVTGVVPEPSSALLAAGALAVGLLRRRRPNLPSGCE